jgi:predicted RecA/RadA family phage recombinase
MTALTANKDTNLRDGRDLLVPVKGSTKIYAGAGVIVGTATGLAVPAGDVAAHVRCGIATDLADNSAGSDGAEKVRVRRLGCAVVKYTGTAPTVGATVYWVDDQTVQAAATTNTVKAGIVVLVDSGAGEVLVDLAQ